MSPEERQLLTTLFDRVRTASATPRDRDAEAFIDQANREQPYATYYLAQAVVVQEKGLEAAANHIKELEERVAQLEAAQNDNHRAEQGGGFLSSIFGSGQSQQRQPAPVQPGQSGQPGPWGSAPRQNYRTGSEYDDGYRAPPQQSPAPWGPAPAAPAYQQPAAGGSFLRGALGTAAGVAGGVLLANSLSGIFGNHMNSLGWGSPFAGSNPFGSQTGNAPVEETVINNNYFGDDGTRQASNDSGNQAGGGNDGGNDGSWQQADYDNSADQPDFDNSGSGNDDGSMDV